MPPVAEPMAPPRFAAGGGTDGTRCALPPVAELMVPAALCRRWRNRWYPPRFAAIEKSSLALNLRFVFTAWFQKTVAVS